MRYFAQMSEDGVLPLIIRNDPPEPRSAWVAMPPGVNMSDCAGMMLINGEWQPRPRAAAPAIARVTLGWEVRFDGVPDGASCDVYDRDFQELLDDVPANQGSIAFLITDPGTYQLDVTVPAPWVGLTLNVVLA